MNTVFLAAGAIIALVAVVHLCWSGMRHLPLLALLLIPTTAQAGRPYCGPVCYPPKPVVNTVIKPFPQTSTVSTSNNTLSIVNNYTYSQPSAAQGSTLYGSLDDPYTLDLGALLTLHNRTIAQGIDGMTGLGQQYAQLLSDEGERRARVAEIRATGEASERVANAVKSTLQRAATSIVQQGQFNSGSTYTSGNDKLVTYAADSLVATKCSRCHSPEGGTADDKAIAALRTDTGIASIDRLRAISAVLLDDEKHRMPLGERLDADTIGQLIQELSR